VRSVSGKELCRILERRGWVLRHVSGAHHVYVRPGHPGHVSVPVHGNRSLGKGIQHTLMRQAGLTDADL
jgi:predicted RNA binding protein YcfA (HicA-like mRNA interferase family)